MRVSVMFSDERPPMTITLAEIPRVGDWVRTKIGGFDEGHYFQIARVAYCNTEIEDLAAVLWVGSEHGQPGE